MSDASIPETEISLPVIPEAEFNADGLLPPPNVSGPEKGAETVADFGFLEDEPASEWELPPAPPVDPKVDPGMASEVETETLERARQAAALLAAQKDAPPSETPPGTATEPGAPEESFADIYSEFQRTHSRREGESRIRGTVVAVTADSVLVDIGFKSEGILPLAAFPAGSEPANPGDALEVSVKGRDQDGYYELSLFRTAIPRDWSSLERAFEEKSTIVGTVTGVIKGGLHVDVGVRAFLPASRSGARDAAEMEKLIGQEIRVRITKLDVQDEDVVVDRRVVTEEEAQELKTRRYAEVREGAVVDGAVRSITEYGAFLDLDAPFDGLTGLLHISDLAWSRVANVGDILTVGQQLEVKILKIDPETRRIALGLKQLQAHPWDAVAEKYSLGQRVRGVVSRIADFGAFIELEPGVEGLVHLSEMSWSKRIHKATEVVNVGDVVDAVILSIAIPERRIGLGLKQALGDPWVEAAARLAPGSVVEGPVASITRFGAFIQVSEGVEGLVHISEIAADRRLNRPSDLLHVGQVVRALVLELDKDKRQLRLSIKQLIPTGLDEFLAEHKVADRVTGRVVSIAGGSAQVEVGDGILCRCTLPEETAPAPAPAATGGKVDLSAFSSMLASKWKTGSADAAGSGTAAGKEPGREPVIAGQVRSFRISQLDAGAKQIVLELAT
jgi:small subunit ribosomal protein S1